jgi:hypothetical protein
MAVSPQSMADIQARFQELQARLDTTTKDLTLLTLVPKWSGTEKSGSLQEFLSAVENMAEMGNWSDRDKVRIATMKLEDAARVLVEAASEIRGREVSWADFKKALQQRFRDPRIDNFHFLQLVSVKQKMGESVLSFADRVRTLGRKITPTSDDPAVLKACSDQADRMVLATFSNGLGCNPGKHARYNLPTSQEDAIRVAVTVEQAEACHPKSDAFNLEEKAIENRDRKGERRIQTKDRGWRSNSPRKNGQASDPTERLASGIDRDATCYSCGGRGHYSRVCPTRIAETRSVNRYAGNEAKNKDRARQG